MKPGGPIPDKGKRIIVRVKNIKDLCRDVIKVYAPSPELRFVVFPFILYVY